jgi:hypothetical protein
MTRFFRSIPAVVAVAACEPVPHDGPDVDRALDPMNVIDETNLSDIMLTAADPDEAVAYFQRAVPNNPTGSTSSAGSPPASCAPAARPRRCRSGRGDRASRATIRRPVDYADALIRTGDWDGPRRARPVPPTFETYKRYRLEAMVADSNRNGTAPTASTRPPSGLTTRPAN